VGAVEVVGAAEASEAAEVVGVALAAEAAEAAALVAGDVAK
jgi:hypothetical protein